MFFQLPSVAQDGVSISVTDYWFDGGPGYFHYGDGRTNHTFEAQAESRSASQDSTGMPLCAGIPHLSN